MPVNTVELDAYFQRIGFSGGRQPSLETLQELHFLHPIAIPFENLSPLLGLAVNLDSASLRDKLIEKKRGGYCFEHNLLFQHVLEALGFKVKGLSARVHWNVPEQIVLPRNHMLLHISIEGMDYIADVGFGGLTLTAPLRLEPGLEQPSPHETFRLVCSDTVYTLSAKIGENWKAMYTFDLQQQHQSDYELTNWYVSTHPNSRFVNELIAARPEPGRRHALLNNDYSIYYAGGKIERKTLADVRELMEILTTAFHIPLDNLPGIEQRLKLLSVT